MGATGYIIKGHNSSRGGEARKEVVVSAADGTIDVEKVETFDKVDFRIKTTYDGYETINVGSPAYGGYFKAAHIKFNKENRRYRLVCILNGGSYTPVAKDFAIYYIKFGWRTGGVNSNHWYIEEYSRQGNGAYVSLEQIALNEYNVLIHTPTGYAYANIGILKEDKEPDVTIDHFNNNTTRYTPTGTIIETETPAWKNGALVETNPEDLEIRNGRLQLADRSSIDGLGYAILRPDKTFAEQVVQANTIYEVRYNFDLGGGSVTIPSNCTLKFDGGKLMNGSVVGTLTNVDAGNQLIFDGVDFLGTWGVQEIPASWFIQDEESGAIDCTDAFERMFALAAISANPKVSLHGIYLITGDNLSIPSNIKLVGTGSATIKTDSSAIYQSMFSASAGLRNVDITGIIFDQFSEIGKGYSIGTPNPAMKIIECGEGINVRIHNCVFKHIGVHAVCFNGFGNRDNIFLYDNVFEAKRADDNVDMSTVYIQAHHYEVQNNILRNISTNKNLLRINGGIECHGGIAICTGNIISDYKIGINLQTATNLSDVDYESAMIISQNNIQNCSYGISMFATKKVGRTEDGLKNIAIQNNIIELSFEDDFQYLKAHGISTSTYPNGSLKSTIISGNYISHRGNYDSSATYGNVNPAELSAISISADGGCDNVIISQNKVENFPGTPISLRNNTGAEILENVDITDNTFYDCGYLYNQAPGTVPQMAFLSNCKNISIRRNTYTIVRDRDISKWYLIYGYVKCDNVDIYENIIEQKGTFNTCLISFPSGSENIKGDLFDLSEGDEVNVITDASSFGKPIYNNKGRYFFVDGGLFCVPTKNGTLRTIDAIASNVSGESYITINDANNYIKVGDYVDGIRTSTGLPLNKTFRVICIFEDCILLDAPLNFEINKVINAEPTFSEIVKFTSLNKGTTAQRPTLALTDAGFQYFDTDLGKPIYWTGAKWVDATGADLQ